MTQEDKELLLKDLCARLPYGVKCQHPYGIAELVNVDIDGDWVSLAFDTPDDNDYRLDKRIKPYLRPMSSMTEEEWKEYNQTIGKSFSFTDEVDWLNAHHFDYRGLIEKGLALEAPEGMYNN